MPHTPSPAELGLLSSLLVGAVLAGILRWRRSQAEPAPSPEPRWQLGTLLCFVAALTFLIAYHQHRNPFWVPHGADWDAWYQSAVAFQQGLALHPIARWPLNGAMAAAVDLFVPGPLFMALQIQSLLAAAAAVAAVYLLGHLLLGRFAGVAAAGLALLQPNCLEIAQWSSAYNLWAASACWGAAGLVAGLKTGRAGWWVAAGLGITGTLATMPKGLPMGVGLLGLALPLAAVTGRPRWKAAAALLAPLLLVGTLYAAFPEPLASLDGLVRYARHGDHHRQVGQAMDFDLSEGYVFGKSSGPATIWRTASAMRAEGDSDPEGAQALLRTNLQDLRAEYRGGGPWLLGWLGLGLLGGAVSSLLQRGQRRAAWGWLAVLGIAAAVAPSLWLHLNTRFLLPLFWILALPLVAPLALVSRGGPRWLRPLPLLAWGCLLLAGSPWRFGPGRVDVVDVYPPEGALWLHYQLAERAEIEPLHVCADPFTNWFALDAVGGQAGPQGFDDRKVWELPEPGPEHYLLVREDPMLAADGGGPYPCDVSDRPLVESWDLGGPPVELYGPVGSSRP
jgi:hypothetical protein